MYEQDTMPVASRRAYSDTAGAMKPRATFLLRPMACAIGSLAIGSLAGCGTRTLDDLSRATTPLVVYTRDTNACAVTSNKAAEDELKKTGSGEDTAVVEIAFVNACNGVGGQFVLARTLDKSRMFWLGTPGCVTWETPPTAKYGVIRYSQTAALFDLPAGVCLKFPDGPDGLKSDSNVQALAVYATQAEAQRLKDRL